MNVKDSSSEARFAIGELSRRTQVNTVTLRAWERRYGLLKPTRTAKGHRLYSEADVDRVKDILTWISRGVPVGKVRELLRAKPQGEQQGDGDSSSGLTLTDNHWSSFAERLVSASLNFSPDKSQALLQEILGQYPVAQVALYGLEPSFQQLADEHAASIFLQSEIMRYALMRLYRQPQGDQQMLLAFGEGSDGWRLAVAGLLMADAGLGVNLVSQPCTIETWCVLAEQCADRTVVIFQDGQLPVAASVRVQQLLLNRQNVILCGSAGVLASSGMETQSQVFSRLEDFLKQYLPAG